MYYLIEDLGECVTPQYSILHIIHSYEYALEKLNNLNEEKEKNGWKTNWFITKKIGA